MTKPTSPRHRDDMIRVRRVVIARIERHIRKLKDARYTALSDNGIALLVAEQLTLHRECEELAKMTFTHLQETQDERTAH